METFANVAEGRRPVAQGALMLWEGRGSCRARKPLARMAEWEPRFPNRFSAVLGKAACLKAGTRPSARAG
jgi:hypothetical protein